MEQTLLNVSYSLLENQKGNLPLVIKPDGDTSVSALANWLRANKEEIGQKLTQHGAILMRGFDAKSEPDYETVAKAIEEDLKNVYLGTSPRNQRSQYVFNASELPDYYPIMQHCEMSFLKSAPRRLFFFCKTAPPEGGQTPITDFRKVYQQLNPAIKEEFEKKGIKNIRNYNGPSSPAKFDLWKLKRWDEMFNTTDKTVVEAACAANDIQVVWKGDDKLTLINEQETFKKHPITGEMVWFNHLQVFHKDAASIEYSKIVGYQKNIRSVAVNGLVTAMSAFKNLLTQPENQAMHCTFADGTEIPKSYVQHVIDVIWDNLVIFKWQQGDIIVIDNFSTSHGRLPYSGPREILVAWSS